MYVAQHDRYEGHLRDEMYLYWVLIKVYRSPETLLRITKRTLDPYESARWAEFGAGAEDWEQPL